MLSDSLISSSVVGGGSLFISSPPSVISSVKSTASNKLCSANILSGGPDGITGFLTKCNAWINNNIIINTTTTMGIKMIMTMMVQVMFVMQMMTMTVSLMLWIIAPKET